MVRIPTTAYHVGEVPVINEDLVVRLSLRLQVTYVVIDHTFR